MFKSLEVKYPKFYQVFRFIIVIIASVLYAWNLRCFAKVADLLPGLEIRDIKQFMEWCQEGSRTYELRKQLFERQKAAVEKEMEKMQETLDMLTFKCFYYEQAIKDGNEDGIHSMLPDKLPADIQAAYDNSHK